MGLTGVDDWLTRNKFGKTCVRFSFGGKLHCLGESVILSLNDVAIALDVFAANWNEKTEL